MIRLGLSANDQDIASAIGNWVDALIRESYEEAYGLTWHGDPDDSWTSAEIQRSVESWGNPDEIGRFRVTSPTLAGDALGIKSGRLDIERYHDDSTPVLASVTCDLALNGNWSDLSAVFNVRAFEGYLVLELLEIGVL